MHAALFAPRSFSYSSCVVTISPSTRMGAPLEEEANMIPSSSAVSGCLPADSILKLHKSIGAHVTRWRQLEVNDAQAVGVTIVTD